MAREIPLSRGFVTIVDDADYEWLSQWKWSYKNVGGGGAVAESYAGRTDNHRRKTLYMHREILQASKGDYCDHINGNGLDNRRSNLRLCTNGQNLFNKDKPRIRKATSKYKGVVLRRTSRGRVSWAARIKANKKGYWIGTFATELDAARAYDAAARELHGAFAYLNFPADATNATAQQGE